jgi:hypothetical protein
VVNCASGHVESVMRHVTALRFTRSVKTADK